MTAYLYYPGCSMEGSARAYAESLAAIAGPLGLDLETINDWNCCGATEYVSLNLIPAYALIGRNLALAAQQAQAHHQRTIVAPCSACYLNLEKANYYMRERPVLGKRVNEALAAGGLHYEPGSLLIRHLLDVLINDVGLDKIQSLVKHPLTGLRVAPYLGCMVPRPDYDQRWSNPEYPNELDRLLKALGAEVIDFPLKTHCCGGHMTQISPAMAFELMRRLYHAAADYHADLMATVCPMCQMNLDAYQAETNSFFHANYHMPIVFFTQLIGLAMGLDAVTVGFGREFVDARPALARIGVSAPPPNPEPAQPRKKAEGLPMPEMPENK